MTRRSALRLAVAPLLASPAHAAVGDLRIDGIEFFVVRATKRTAWFFIRLKTNKGLMGIGECSDSLGANFDDQGLSRLQAELESCLSLIKGEPPNIELYRNRGRQRAARGAFIEATAFSAVEQALWALLGKALDAPVYELLGGPIRTQMPVYANVNRMTVPRTPDGFAASATRAVEDGFRTVKGAPFDGFPRLRSATPQQIHSATDLGIACIHAMRQAIGPDVRLLIDAHSNFDVKLAIDVAKQLEPENLGWYEEPVSPRQVEDTLAIRKAITQRMAGGESLFGTGGFAPLCRTKAVDIIMPDVKHCGGILEGRQISALADLEEVKIAPHNPSGPVATAASAHWCATIPNFDVLEYQWNEVPWRSNLIDPPEWFVKGMIQAHAAPGFGIRLNDRMVRAHATL